MFGYLVRQRFIMECGDMPPLMSKYPQSLKMRGRFSVNVNRVKAGALIHYVCAQCSVRIALRFFCIPAQVRRVVCFHPTEFLLHFCCCWWPRSIFSAMAQEGEQKSSPSPMRLSYVEGEVSFWRDGAEDWVEARLNTPLAAGDALYVGKDGDLELQMGSRAFVRADDDTNLSVVNQTADFVQFKITAGRVSFDLRALPSGNSIEVDTPNAVFTIDHAGYYRVDVDGDVNFTTRRGGRAMVIPAGGKAMSIHPSEEIVVQGTRVAQAETYVAPELDVWDRWNYDRTEELIDAVSERYLPYGVAGASELDRYGNWRVVADYGSVWVPASAPPGWAPYSTGSWAWDPYYQWTWIDDAPWGWAPFHYGRWVYLGGYWAWAPGPVVRQAVYAPAMVAFFGVGANVSVGFSVGGAGVGWVALSWGEPLMPWWGQPAFIGVPWWGGWGGPRVVNNVVVRNTTVINVTNITYNNTRVNKAVVATPRERFGKGQMRDESVRVKQPRELTQVRGTLPVKPDAVSLVAGTRKGIRPPPELLSRSVVSARPAREARLPWRTKSAKDEPKPATEQRVKLPKRSASELPRPAFGAQTGAERPRPPSPPRYKERLRAADTAPPPVIQGREQERIAPEPRKAKAAKIAPRAVPEEVQQQQESESADLPGKPANRMYRGRGRDGEGGNRRQRSQDVQE